MTGPMTIKAFDSSSLNDCKLATTTIASERPQDALDANIKDIVNGDVKDINSRRHGSAPLVVGKSGEYIAADHEIKDVGLEPIAIVGMAVRFPQGADSPDDVWKMLVEGRCASTEFPKDRLNIDGFWNSDPEKLNSICTRNAHFLEGDIRAFDPAFFSMTPQEASSLDPQHRGMMETTYHALENGTISVSLHVVPVFLTFVAAGIPLEQIAGSNTSVHVGCFTTDFLMQQFREPQQIPKYSATGTASSILSNRLSWFYNLHGPSLTVDTACSSSLVALDLACKGLWEGTSDTAIVGSANLICTPELNMALCNMNFLSPEGRCYSFDDRANGYARGEGFATLVLKPLSKALRSADTIRALIRSVGVNQDGHTSGGITQPSKDMQAHLIRETYNKAGLDMGVTRFFEAHGTGTAVGDPTEARAIGECFRKYRSADDPLYVGAVKSNFGHLEGTSGFAGLVKAVLAVEKGLIPPNTNFERLNPEIDDQFFHLKFPTRCHQWPTPGVRRASINSFGFGGTNAHVVIDGAEYHKPNTPKIANENRINKISEAKPAPQMIEHAHFQGLGKSVDGDTSQRVKNLKETEFRPLGDKDIKSQRCRLFILSAGDENGPKRQAKALSRYLSQHANTIDSKFLENLSYTLNIRRTALAWRSYAVIDSTDNLFSLEQAISKPVYNSSTNLGLGCVFTGQGAQWVGMGRELLSCTIFKESIMRSQNYLFHLGCKWSLLNEMMSDGDIARRNSPEVSQILSTSIQIALVDLAEWLGITPAVVVGHSSGEIAAAYCAGYLCQNSALRVSYYRGVLASKLAESTIGERHSMASIGLSSSEATLELEALAKTEPGFDSNQLTVSCINSPKTVTISGPDYLLDILVELMKKREVFARKLKVDVGYHSPQMWEIAHEYMRLLRPLEPRSKPRKVPMVSSVTAGFLPADVAVSSDYWAQNMKSQVQFLDAMKLCCTRSEKHTIIKKLDRSHLQEIVTHGWLEIGPHSALRGPVREILTAIGRKAEVSYTSALIRHQSATKSILETLGQLSSHNFKVDLLRAAHIESGSMLDLRVLYDLPQYSFNHSIIHWEESSKAKAFKSRQHAHNDLLGSQVSDWNPIDAKWKLLINEENLPWVKDHKVNGAVLYPAAGMLVMAIEAIKQLLPDQQKLIGFEIQNVEFHSPIVLSIAPAGVETQISLAPKSHFGGRDIEYNFRLFLFKSDEAWEQVCHGSIQADYGTNMQNVDGGKATQDRVFDYQAQYQRTVESCTGIICNTDFYKKMRDLGLEYGPTFQALSEIQFNSLAKATATVLPYKLLAESFPSESPFTVHPSTLDSIFQLLFVALEKSVDFPLQTMVPTRLRRLWVSSLGVGQARSAHERANTEAQILSSRSAMGSTTVFSEPGLDLKIVIEELEVTAVSNTHKASTTDDMKNMYHHMDWKIDLDTLDQVGIRHYCETSQNKTAEPVDWFCDMTLLATCFAVQALQEIQELRQAPIPSMQSHVAWLEARIADGFAELSTDKCQQREELLKSKQVLSELCNRLGPTSKRGYLHVKVGQNLAKILLGEANVLELLFGDEQLMADFYEELNLKTNALSAAEVYLDTLVHKNPKQRFFEIGAGTGATTSSILNTLQRQEGGPRFEEYMFTDISASFFPKANERFRNYERMRYRIFNVEEELPVQGIEEAQYDVVIAAQVLHATKTLATTIQNVRRLLKPGGKLLLLEMTTPNRMLTGFIFGLLPGWWLGSESYRQGSPCVPEFKWDGLLKENGFSGTDMVIHDYESEDCHGWSFMVSTAVSPSENLHVAEALQARSTLALVLDQDSSIQQELATQVVSRYRSLHTQLEMLTWEELITIPDLQSRDFIVLYDVGGSILHDIGEKSFKSLQKLLTSTGCVLWVNSGAARSLSAPYWALIEGLSRVSRVENNKITLVTLGLEIISHENIEQSSKQIAKIFDLTVKRRRTGSVEPEYMEVNGSLCINRVSQAKYLNEHIFNRTGYPVRMQAIGSGPPLKMGIRAPGLLDTLEWSEDKSAHTPLLPDEIVIDVRAIGVNFKECLTLLGRVNTDQLGSECAGYVHQVGSKCKEFRVGDRVVACLADSYKTYARTMENYCVKIPDNLSFAEAAAIPTACCTAYFGLVEIARIRKDESVLIHAAAGGTGQSAVQIAKNLGVEIFATVGSEAKKKLLIDQYGLLEDHIFYSRDTSFADGIRRITNGRGVDVILNSLSGKALVASWNCIAPFGRFIEIGRKDIDSRGSLPMYPFIKNTMFAGVDLGRIVDRKDGLGKMILNGVFSMVRAGKLRPSYPLHRFPLEKIEDAFHFLQSGRSSGKIVVEVTKDAIVPTVMSSNSNYSFPNDASYVISGGLGGIGRSIAYWMVSRGARNLILLSRSGPDKIKKAQAMLAEMERQGVKVRCPVCDVADLASLHRALEVSLASMPPIKGCFQAAMVLRDSTFQKMSYTEWSESIRPKVQGSWNLHSALPSGLDFFILLSSVCGIFGNGGQSNYAAGNTFQDALARWLVERGEKAVSLDLGIVLGEGFVAENKQVMDRLLRLDILSPISQSELFAMLDYYCNPSMRFSSPAQSQAITGLELPANLRAKGLEPPLSLCAPMFSHMHQISGAGQVSLAGDEQTQDTKSLLVKTSSLEEAGTVVAEALRDKVCRVLGVSPNQMSLSSQLESYGVDSLVALELRNWLAKETRADVAVFEILGGPSLIDVGMTAARKSELKQASWTE